MAYQSYNMCCYSYFAGASGLVIERAAADRLRLPCIGEIHVSGVAGKTRSCFRRAASIQVQHCRIACQAQRHSGILLAY